MIGNIVFDITIVINSQVTIPVDVSFGTRISALTRATKILIITNFVAMIVEMDMVSGTIVTINDRKRIVDTTEKLTAKKSNNF